MQKTIVVTGSRGFVGTHLMEALLREPGVRVLGFDLDATSAGFEGALAQADVVFHLAGVNRPASVDEFEPGNAGVTSDLCSQLERLGRFPAIVFSSSIQAERDNPYGQSKRHAEEALAKYAARTGAPVIIYRLKNLFGNGCRPNYNSVVATFCHNIARDLPIEISNPDHLLELVYIDDVMDAFVNLLREPMPGGCAYPEIPRSFKITLGALAGMIRSFRASRQSLQVPSLTSDFSRFLYATFLSYLEGGNLSYALDARADSRGALAEFLKSPELGQIFVSRTRPGITRGNHYHHTKAEKFLVLEGNALIRLRCVGSGDNQPPGEIIVYQVAGTDFRVVDIPPGYAHSIENIGSGELVVLFWASEIFDPNRADTLPLQVQA